MFRQGRRFSVAIKRGLYMALAMAMMIIGTQAQAQPLLTHHVRDAVTGKEARFLKPLNATKTLRLDVVLQVRDQDGLDNFLQALYDPSSPSYRKYLTVEEFTSRFGPSQEDYDAVVDFARSSGLNVVGGSRDGMDVQVEGTVATIESAFHVILGVYHDTQQNRSFYAPDKEPSVDLPFQLWHISGLDNYSIPHPLYNRKNIATKPNATTGSGPSSSYLGSDMRAAYYGSGSLTGTGQTLGLLEYEGTNLDDLKTYYTNAHQTNQVPIKLISTDGTSTSCNAPSCDDAEQTLDMTQALGMAPGLANLIMYIGNTDTAIFSSMTSTNPLPMTIGCSWGWTPADPSTLNPYFQRMAAQGQTFFAASGDNATWSAKNEAWPADSPYVLSVGGTDLVTVSAGGAWASETAWANSGGGISPDNIAIPTWQQLAGVINSSNQGSKTLRNGPDVAANADNTFYVCANQTTCSANQFGGTSFAAPMWAAYIALANQQAIANGNPVLGFINPTIYSIGVSPDYNVNFHDITSGKAGRYSAVIGYDLVTGWGSMNGAALINALAPVTTGGFSLSTSQNSISIVAGNSGNVTVNTTVTGGFKSPVTLSASGLPLGAVATFNPTSITGNGSATMTLTVDASTLPGSYLIPIIGKSGSQVVSTKMTLTITPQTAAGNFMINASPTLLGLSLGSSTSTKITSTVSCGFNSQIGLSVAGLPAGVTAAFSPTSITGAGSSVLTLNANAQATRGLYSVTISGTSGNVTNSANAFLFIF